MRSIRFAEYGFSCSSLLNPLNPLFTANSAVSCVNPTLTTARSSPISYAPQGSALVSSSSAKACQAFHLYRWRPDHRR